MLTRQEVNIAVHDKRHRVHQDMLRISKEFPTDWVFDNVMAMVRMHLELGAAAAIAHRGIQAADRMLTICSWMVVLEDDELANPEASGINPGSYGMGYFRHVAEKYHFNIEGLKTSNNPGGFKSEDASP